MNSSLSRTLASVAVFAALIIATGLISIPSPTGGVPIVVQNAFCVLAGLVLGPKRGTYAVLVFLLLGLFGLPVLPGGRSVLAAVAGPTLGYIIGYAISPLVAGAISRPFLGRKTGALTAGFALAGFAGLLTHYIFGVPGLVMRTDMDFAAALAAQAAFIPGMVLKLVAITLISVAVVRALPDVR